LCSQALVSSNIVCVVATSVNADIDVVAATKKPT